VGQGLDPRSPFKTGTSFAGMTKGEPGMRMALDLGTQLLKIEGGKDEGGVRDGRGVGREEIEGKISARIQIHHADLAHLLITVPGVGPTPVAVLIAEVPELGQLSRREISTLPGVAPLDRDSGQMRGKRTIFAGRAQVRRCLPMATWAAIRWNKVIKRLYDRLVAAGKFEKVAIVACMRKLLTVLNAMARAGQIGDESLHAA